MGIGKGLQEGVQMTGNFIMPAMQMKQQQKQFDASMGQRKSEMDQREKLFHDRLSMEQGWKEGFYGMPSMSEESHGLPPDAFPRLPASPITPQAQPALPPDAFPRTPTPAQALTPQAPPMQDPTIRPMPGGGPRFLPPVSKMEPKFSMPGFRTRRY